MRSELKKIEFLPLQPIDSTHQPADACATGRSSGLATTCGTLRAAGLSLGTGLQTSKADAADVMQEAMLAVSRKVASFQVSKGSFRGWLWRISQNKIRDHFRKLARQPASPGGSTALQRFAQIPELESTDDPTSPLESHRLLHRALSQIQDQFNANTWQAFWKTTVESQDTRSVAEALKMSQNHVRQAKSRVLRRLREQLNDPDL